MRLRFRTSLFIVAVLAIGGILALRLMRVHDSADWLWQYDASGRPIALTTPGTKKTRIMYEENKAGQVRSVEKKFDDGSKSRFELDAYGRIKRMIDVSGSTDYEYDGFDRITLVRRSGLPSLSYQYDASGKLKGYSIGKSWNVAYTYDFLDRIAKLDTPIGAIQYRYDSAARTTTRVFPNGLRTSWQYQVDGLLRSITHVGPDDRIVLKFTYSYRPDGLIDGVDEYSPRGTEQRHYEYDHSRRLVSVLSSAHGRVSYRYDSLGHRLAQIGPDGKTTDISYSWSGGVSSINGKKVTSDVAGNITNYVRNGDPVAITYTGTNAANSVSISNRKARYTYDGAGFLVGRTLGHQTTSFLNDTLASHWQPLMSHDSSGKDGWYLWDNGVPLAVIKSGVPSFLLTDHLGSVRLLVAQDGRVNESRDYDAFGVLTAGKQTDDLSFGMAGLAFDAVAGLYITRHRSYDPNLGTFLQRDPVISAPSSATDFASYTYCANDPINFRDIDGAEPTPPPNFDLRTEIAETLSHPVRNIADTLAGRYGGGWQFAENVALGISLQAGSVAAEVGAAEWYAGRSLAMFGKIKGARLPIIEASKLGKIDLGIGESIPGQMLDYSKIPIDYLVKGGRIGAPHLGVALEDEANFHIQAARIFESKSGINVPISPLLPFALRGAYDAAAMPSRLPLGSDSGPYSISISDSTVHTGGSVPPSTPSAPQSPSDSGPYTVSVSDSTFHTVGPPSGGSVGIGVNSGKLEPVDASNVGGIYLRGAADALKGLGVLIGLAVDNQSGRLVLISEQGKVGLPPFRMDDLVAIFRSVYNQGESPWVTIDPNPANPKGPIMIVRQGAATARTYVGWVLFEADRVMKVYSLGMDNLERKHLVSQIPGYPDIMKLMFEPHGGGSVWERFWIVPAQVVRKHSPGHDLTIFDVPLKVNTQRMVLHNGKLIPAGQTPTRSAEAFTKWFTEHYDEITNESRSVPPTQSEISSLVPVFEELRRVSLISAIAEKLRDDGVPLPFWMEQYATHQVTFAQTTPSIIAANENKRVSIYGGVNLSPADDQIRDLPDSAEASAVVPLIAKALQASASFSAVTTPETGKLKAIALPGEDTKDFSPGFLEETDLAVLTEAGELSLSRRFHSFFKPEGEFGASWTLDLPHLQTQRRPTQRKGDLTTFTVAYALRSPLATYDAIFVDRRFVPELNSELFVPAKPGDILGIASIRNYQYGAASQVAFFRDGQKLYFDRTGNLICWIKGSAAVLYKWSSQSRLVSMQALSNGLQAARIDFSSDSDGRIVAARDSLGGSVSYSYDDAGHLVSAGQRNKHREYCYRNDLVTQVSESGKKIRSLTFDLHGHLRKQESDGVVTEHKVYRTSEGTRVVSLVNGRETDVAEFDTRQRPRFRKAADGRVSTWTWNPDGSATINMSFPRQGALQIRVSADRSRYEVRTTRGAAYVAELDGAGRPVAGFLGASLAFRANWQPDGKIATLQTENSVVDTRYDGSGSLSELMFHEPGENGELKTWQVIRFANGRPALVADSSGMQAHISYDESGTYTRVRTPDSEIVLTNDRNARAVHASWGEDAELRYDSGTRQPVLYRLSRAGAEMSIRYEAGYPASIRGFFGEMTAFEYELNGPNQKRLKAIHRPGGSVLHYEYDKQGRLAEVECANAYRLRYEYDDRGRLVRASQRRPGG